MDFLMYYLYGINILTFLLYGLDKALAMMKLRRISEKTLLIASLLGGAFLGLTAMVVFRHKIRKRYFVIINILGILIYMSFIGGFYGNR